MMIFMRFFQYRLVDGRKASGLEMSREAKPLLTALQLKCWRQSKTEPGEQASLLHRRAAEDAEHAQLRTRGLQIGEVKQEPNRNQTGIKQEPWRREALFTDPGGNGWIPRQPLALDATVVVLIARDAEQGL